MIEHRVSEATALADRDSRHAPGPRPASAHESGTGRGASATPARYRCIVAESSWHYARALAAGLARECGIEVVGIAHSTGELLDLVERTRPRAAVVDLDLLPDGGPEACETLARRFPGVAVVVTAGDAAPGLACRCLVRGARAYIVKKDRDDPARVAAALRNAARGDHLLDHELVLRLVREAPDPVRDAGLTPRERDVLPLVAEGLLNKQIAQRLRVSEQTVKNHLSSIYRKLGVTNRTGAVTAARRRGIPL